jgi:hypothetical protein
MYARYKIFRSDWHSWDALFQQAAEFLTHVGPSHTIGVSHSQEASVGVVTVWYWSEVPDIPPIEVSAGKPREKS